MTAREETRVKKERKRSGRLRRWPTRPLKEALFKNQRGQIRLPWILFAAAALYALCVPALEWLYGTGFDALMGLWGVTERNIARAPWFVRQLVRFSGVILQLLTSVLLLILSRAVVRRGALKGSGILGPNGGKACAHGAAWGAGSLAALWAALLLTDSMRLGRSLIRPAWSVNTLVLPLTLALFAAAGLCWGIGLVFRALSGRLPSPVAIAAGAALLLPVTLNQVRVDALSAVNALLCGALCCLSAQKKGSWAWAFGFLAAIWILERAVLGFPGFSAALYETYPVNSYWLNGGERGLWHGAGLTIVMLGHLWRFLRRPRGKGAS